MYTEVYTKPCGKRLQVWGTRKRAKFIFAHRVIRRDLIRLLRYFPLSIPVSYSSLLLNLPNWLALLCLAQLGNHRVHHLINIGGGKPTSQSEGPTRNPQQGPKRSRSFAGPATDKLSASTQLAQPRFNIWNGRGRTRSGINHLLPVIPSSQAVHSTPYSILWMTKKAQMKCIRKELSHR